MKTFKSFEDYCKDNPRLEPNDLIAKHIWDAATASKQPFVFPIEVCWEYEDQLPALTSDLYMAMHEFSKVVDGVRMFAYIRFGSVKYFLT